ncbi:MAG TPA: hypothetical protein DCR97_12190 [Deltaproteobacteria bacterium]|nr:hypothetical protein [Deltaproteobacteria bacterium]
MKTRLGLSLFAAVLIFFLCAGYLARALSSESPGCVKCHTDEQILKSLYTPPKLGPSEGEG